MGVQVRVPRAGVVVVKGRDDQAVGVDLRDPARAGAGQRPVGLDVGQGTGDRAVVGVQDRPRGRHVTDSPQH